MKNINKSLRVRELERIEYKKVTRAIREELSSLGFNGLELEEHYTNAIDSRLSDLGDLIDIEEYI